MMLHPTDTIAALAALLPAQREAARAVAIAGAKTQEARLLAAGVLVTCDDEHDSAARYSKAQAEVVAAGGLSTDYAAIHAILDRYSEEADIRAVRLTLKSWIRQNESDAERNARLDAAFKAAKSVDKPKCRHGNGKAWINKYGGYNMHAKGADGLWHFVCTKCRATAVVAPLTAPTEQAKLAARIFTADKNARYGVKLAALEAEHGDSYAVGWFAGNRGKRLWLAGEIDRPTPPPVCGESDIGAYTRGWFAGFEAPDFEINYFPPKVA